MHKNILTVVGITILILCIILSGCNSPDYDIGASRVDEEPEVYINITEQQMENYPHLQKAIESEGESIDIPYEEFNKVKDLLNSNDTKFIKYKNEYYRIFLSIGCL